MSEYESYQDFERAVARAFEQQSWQVFLAPNNNPGYDIELKDESDLIAVQVKQLKRSIPVPHIQKFLDYLSSQEAKNKNFSKAYFVAANGFSQPAITLANQHGIKLFSFQRDSLQQVTPEYSPIKAKAQPLYIGVFTAKGGVGKTTISAHLAGSFALMGYDVALIDLDPQQNLKTLLPQGIYVKGSQSNLGNIVTVSDYQEWRELGDEAAKVVVCDCSPEFSSNPPELMAKLDYCLVPTTLNPLGINKNGHVVLSTLKHIRQLNKKALLYVLINNYYGSEGRKSSVLKGHYQQLFKEIQTQDGQFHFIDPDQCAIRHSKQLFYWGYHLYSGEEGTLAFEAVGGRCYPKEDFLTLLDYLERHTQIVKQKQPVGV
ncbi:MAG: AAA family ATPase [Deinococcales bacterium]